MEWIKVIALLVVGCLFIMFYFLFNAKIGVISRSDEMMAKIYGIEENGDYFRYFLKYYDNNKEIKVKSVNYRGMELKYQEGDEVSISIVKYESGTLFAELSDEDLIPVSDNNMKGTIVLLIIGAIALILSLGLAIRIII